MSSESFSESFDMHRLAELLKTDMLRFGKLPEVFFFLMGISGDLASTLLVLER